MYKVILRVAVVVILGGTGWSARGLVCQYEHVVYSVEAGGYEWKHDYWVLSCEDTTGGGTGDGGGSGGPGVPAPSPTQLPPPPAVKIVSASDQNPDQVTLNFEYSGAPTSMTLTKNGQTLSSGPPAAFGFYGSLDNMVSDTILTVTMCNAGGCAGDAANVYRATTRKRAQGAVQAGWVDVEVGSGPPPSYSRMTVGSENYLRILEVEFFGAEYSVRTEGLRNGLAKHVQSVDTLLWTDEQRSPIWDVAYQIYPARGGAPYAETALDGAGCRLATGTLSNQSARCTTMGEFGHPWYPGSGKILFLTASGSGWGMPEMAAGDLQLDVFP